MDEISTKSIIIGVSIFITVIIITVVIFEFDQISSIYKHVSEADISFEDRLDELDKFRDSNNIFNGLDVLNTIEKYKNDNTIDTCIRFEEELKCSDLVIESSQYTSKYTSRLENTNKGYKIIFVGIK